MMALMFVLMSSGVFLVPSVGWLIFGGDVGLWFLWTLLVVAVVVGAWQSASLGAELRRYELWHLEHERRQGGGA